MQRNAAMRADVAQCEYFPILRAADENGLAEQRLVHDATGAQIGADERHVPQSAQQFRFEILHRCDPRRLELRLMPSA